MSLFPYRYLSRTPILTKNVSPYCLRTINLKLYTYPSITFLTFIRLLYVPVLYLNFHWLSVLFTKSVLWFEFINSTDSVPAVRGMVCPHNSQSPTKIYWFLGGGGGGRACYPPVNRKPQVFFYDKLKTVKTKTRRTFLPKCPFCVPLIYSVQLLFRINSAQSASP